MRVVVDGQEVAQLEPGAKAQELLRSLEHEQSVQGRVVQVVLVDGSPVSDWEAVFAGQSGHPEEVHLQTAPLREALAATVADALDYLPRVEAGIREAGSRLREGAAAEGLQLLGEVAAGLQWYADLLAVLNRLELPAQPALQGQAARERSQALQTQLQGVLAAWEQGDYTLLADLLEYELEPEIVGGRNWLAAVQQGLQSVQ